MSKKDKELWLQAKNSKSTVNLFTTVFFSMFALAVITTFVILAVILKFAFNYLVG